MDARENAGNGERVSFLDAIPVAGGGVSPGVNQVAHAVQHLQVLPADRQ